MPINEQEKAGIIDLLTGEEENEEVLMRLAKHLTLNLCEIANAEEAFHYIFTQSSDARILLSKRIITKDILLKYLLKRNIQIQQSLTKVDLVQRIIDYWNTAAITLESLSTNLSLQDRDETNGTVAISTSTSTNNNDNAEEYPINQLARQFTQWFFNNYNTSALKMEDFWSDVRLHLHIAAADHVKENSFEGTADVVEALLHAKHNFGFFFNVNLTHNGVQGRMDMHGMVLVLACGTLHTQENCVGVFECTFGILRDPFVENNWKIKLVHCIYRSGSSLSTPPTLEQSNSFVRMLELPMPRDDLA